MRLIDWIVKIDRFSKRNRILAGMNVDVEETPKGTFIHAKAEGSTEEGDSEYNGSFKVYLETLEEETYVVVSDGIVVLGTVIEEVFGEIALPVSYGRMDGTGGVGKIDVNIDDPEQTIYVVLEVSYDSELVDVENKISGYEYEFTLWNKLPDQHYFNVMHVLAVMKGKKITQQQYGTFCATGRIF